MNPPTIALCMIVRNEEAIIERCLASVSGLIDSWVICDTGSTDGTREAIEHALADVPGELHEIEWVDFGHCRSELLEIARGAADYLLLIDADMTVVVRDKMPALVADAYLLRETGGLDFGVPRLVRGDRRWWYEGSTHEYLATDGRFAQEELDALAIDHHADGSGRWDKLIRDVGLLKRDMASDPANPRPLFYLAQTYRDLGKRELAIDYYRRRVELGGWDEEVFYAAYQEGVLRAEDDLDAAVPVLLEAWQRRPTRAEPLHELARAHRLRGDNSVAHLFASRGLEIGYPADILFVHRWIYEWGLRLERALAAAGIGRHHEARADLSALLDRADLPEHVAEYVTDRLAALERSPGAGLQGTRRDGVTRLAALAPSLRVGEIKLDVRPAWPAFNPSIAADGDGFRMIVRTANYQIERGVLHEDGVLHNVNYLVALDRGLAVTGLDAIADRSTGLRRYDSAIQGYEDCRLFEYDGRWYATATVCDLNPVERREVALLELAGPAVATVWRMEGPHAGRHEKNWMPFISDGALHFVYTCGPTVVLRRDPDSGDLDVIAESTAPAIATEFRGGSQGVPVDGGHLFVVHEVDRSEPALRYLHRFVLLGGDLELAAMSPAFSFTSDRVEFCAG
ncbi:MAG: hypothetical protein QOE63_1741, partial [Acidimicrobiaceae bacterium]